MGCARHSHEGAVGVCAACVSDRLNTEASSSERGGRFAKPSSSGLLSEDHFLWKGGATSSSISKGGKIVDTIASLIKTDSVIPTNYERPRRRDQRHRENHASRSHHASTVEPRVPRSSSPLKDDEAADFRRFNRNDATKSTERYRSNLKNSEIAPAEAAAEQREAGGQQTIYSLIDAEPKSGKFSRSTSKGSPHSYFSRSGSRRQSWTVFWRSDKKDDGGGDATRAAAGEAFRGSDRASSRPVVTSEAFGSGGRHHPPPPAAEQSSSRTNHYYPERSSRTTTRLSAESGRGRTGRRLPDYDHDYHTDRGGDSGYVELQQQHSRMNGAALSHSYERNRSWEQLGLAKLPFASVYYSSGNNNNNHTISGASEQRRNRWKMVKKKSEKLGGKSAAVAADYHHHYHGISSGGTWDEDLGQSSSGKPTPCTSNCFPQSTGRHILRREDAHMSHEKLRHRRLSIYSYGIISHPQLNALDSHLSSYTGGGRSSSSSSRTGAARPYRNNTGKHRESYYYPNGRIAADFWDGDEVSMSPCDHYVEVSRRGADGGSSGIVDFIPVSEAQKKAYDWVERSKIEGNRSPPSWTQRRARQSMMEEGEEQHSSSASLSGDISFLGKEELTTVFEQESESGYGDDYTLDAIHRGADDHYLDEYEQQEDLECLESPNSRSHPALRMKSRQSKGKSIVSEIEELDEGGDDDDNHRRSQQQRFGHIGREGFLSAGSLSDVGSHDSDIVPERSSLSSLFYVGGEEMVEIQGGEEGGEVHEGRAYKPDDYADDEEEDQEVGDWGRDLVDHEHRDGQTNNIDSVSTTRSSWKNITMSPSMRKKFLWPRSSAQPHLRGSTEAAGGNSERGSSEATGSGFLGEHHQSSISFSDSDSHLARPRSPASTIENTSSNLMTSECPEAPMPGGFSDHMIPLDEVTNRTSDTGLSLVEVEESSPKSSPQRSSLSPTSSPQRATLSRSSSKSPQRTLSRCSSRRSRSSSWSSCLTDPAWSSSQSAPAKKGESGLHEKEGPFSSLIRLGKKLSRRSSPANNNSFNTSPWRGFSKASPQRGETTSA